MKKKIANAIESETQIIQINDSPLRVYRFRLFNRNGKTKEEESRNEMRIDENKSQVIDRNLVKFVQNR